MAAIHIPCKLIKRPEKAVSNSVGIKWRRGAQCGLVVAVLPKNKDTNQPTDRCPFRRLIIKAQASL
jgi:hypothetical protein